MNSRRPFLVLTICLFALAVAMALYVWQLRKRADVEPVLTPAPAAAPPTGTPKQVTLWVAYDNPGTLRAQKTSLTLPAEREKRVEQILRALLATYTGKNSPHPLPAGADIRNVYFASSGLAVIDVNSELANGQTSGIFSEELTVASLVETLAVNVQGVSSVKLLVNGKETDTLAGHADLSSPYDVSQVSEFVSQVSSQ